MKKLDINYVRDFIQAQSLETKVYIGGDSRRFRRIANGMLNTP